jgi:repressor LexA
LASALGYLSPRSAAVILEQLTAAGYVRRREDGELQLLQMPAAERDNARTVEVPLVGSAPCGAPLLAEENVEAYVRVSDRLARPHHRYFLLRAVGDSMREAGIPDQALVLVRQQSTAENGQIVVALIDDEATIKEFRRGPNSVTLVPRSRNSKHQPIVLTRDFVIQGIVVAAIPGVPGQ